jgi:hypothetical protein
MSIMAPATYTAFISFLKEELALAPSSVDFALRQRESAYDPLPMILWQYGLVTLEQLAQIYDWLETT